MHFVNELMNYPFLSRAMITAGVVGIVAGIVGCLIILRGLSLMGDAMSHAVLPGVALSFLLNIPMFIGALFTGLLTSVLIGALTDYSKTKKDAAIGIAFTLFFSVGVVMISLMETTTNLYHILFGDVLTVTREAMYTTLSICILVLIIVIVFYQQLKLTTFDPIFSKMNGINPKFWHYTVMMLLALITVVSLQTIGIILVVAMLITPASSAYLISKSLHQMMILSAIFGLISAVIGIYISYMMNVPSGACIVIIATIIYMFTFILSKTNFLYKKGRLL
ncbi:metal ABC transporter permease [Macrococcoides bohemicum]|uniref:metal ABC transporter permease n=1 Tax=Macrococcoides bohemicum TaxID=1903056 RepID=UPI000BB575F0|nr:MULTISPECIES: metal ABC transporter permease [Macrococcus]ATD32026.1 manganese ABC transporter permease [Macrococcus sp. IME1552]TDL38483.1 metal ABC transporter permease [Macrococcus bohemicus]